MDTERPLPQIYGSPKNAEHAIEIEKDEVEEEVMTDGVECQGVRRRKKEMGQKKKEEEEKKKEEEEEDEKRNKEDDDEEEEVMADLVAKILSILKKKEMRRKKKREEEKKEEDEEEEDEAKRKKEDDEGKEEKKKIENEKKEAEEEKKKKHLLRYNQLYKDIKNRHWKKAESAFKQDPSAITGAITFSNGSALHVAIRTGAPVQFIKNLVGLMSKSDLETRDVFEQTALHCAAIVGYTEAAMILVDKNPSLTKFRVEGDRTALQWAAQYAHKKTVLFLLPVTRREDPSAFAGKTGALLLTSLIIADFYDIAIYLLKCYPDLAIRKNRFGGTGLYQLAKKPDPFFSGNQLNFLQRLRYKYIYVEKVDDHHREDVENPAAPEYPAHEPKQRKFKFLQHVHDTKLMHVRAIQLTKILCAEIVKIMPSEKGNLLVDPILLAASLGIHELVWEIVKASPDAIWSWDENKRTIFHLAVVYRKEKVYNLVHQMSLEKHYMMSYTDNSGNTLLHAAGMLGPSDRVSGAALQMQRELQWFKEVETVVQPSFRVLRNNDGKTPREVFTEEHKDLVKKGEEWMKTTATSCTVVAALVITVVFAAAFTLPGGNDSEGFPIFLNDLSFMIFAVSNALAFFASSTSVLMFLGILTSRYSEEDFLRALPMRLCIGLATLFLSIAFMLAAFSSALHIVLVHRLSWVAFPIIALACFPLTLFVFLQFPLLIQMTTSTFGRSIFRRQGKEPLF